MADAVEVDPVRTLSFDTEEAVKEFQRTFNLTPDGIVGIGTWYTVQKIYNSVKRLNDLNSEGISLEEVTAELASRHVIDHKVKQEKMTN